jgi:activator of HSP90 ATPase
MAKVGEGDSRWIVMRRADGKNVDNWHWTEKDLFPWCQTEFETKFKTVSVPSSIADLKIEKTESITGSMIVCNRKGKTIFVFEVQIKLEWTGKASSSDGSEVSGKGVIIVDNIANDEPKWKVTVRMESETSKNRFLREEMNSKVGPIIDNIVNTVLEDMKAKVQDEGAKLSSPSPSTKTETAPVKTPEKRSTPTTQSSSSTTSSGSVSTRSFVQKIVFEVPVEHLFQTITDPNGVSAFTCAPAKIENKVGGEFAILDGAIRGTQVEISPPHKIVQKWRFQTWPENHYSTVTWNFSEDRGGTLITLTQTDIPSSDYERTRNGWERYFWQGIRNAFRWNFKYQ